MSQIDIPVDPYCITLFIQEFRIETRRIDNGNRPAHTQRLRVAHTRVIPSEWTRDSINAAMRGANTIWAAANIQFTLSAITNQTIELPGNLSRLDDNAGQYLINQIRVRPGRITLLLVREFARWDLAGQACRGACILPSSLTPNNRGRVFAHEFGHLLSLGHVDSPNTHLNNVMRPGLFAGPDLTPEQIQQARRSTLATRAVAATRQQPVAP